MDRSKSHLLPLHDGDIPPEPAAREMHKAVKPPSDCLWYSVFVTVCCSCGVGVAATMMSLLSRDARNTGQHHKATYRARLARKLAHVGLVIGLVLMVGAGVLYYQGVTFLMRSQARQAQAQGLMRLLESQ